MKNKVTVPTTEGKKHTDSVVVPDGDCCNNSIGAIYATNAKIILNVILDNPI